MSSGVITNPTVEAVRKIDEEINAMSRRKLITIIEPGASDKVIFVEPFDLGKNDPEGVEEVIEDVLVDTNYDSGYAIHKTKKHHTGEFKKRWQLNPQKFNGPFGPTHRIDTSNQDGKREYESFKRTMDAHVSRHQRVPEPISYHSDVTDQGVMDLRNVSISVADVPVVILENYEPLNKLIERRKELAKSIGMETIEPVVGEEKAVADAQEFIHKCNFCDFVAKDSRALGIHSTKLHGRK